MTQVDLWPDTFSIEGLNAPVNLLREQAALLGKKTNNLVQADVKQDKSSFGKFTYSFYLAAPALNYQYRLFQIHHDVSLYPVIVLVENAISVEISADFERASKQFNLTDLAKMMDPSAEREDVRFKGLQAQSEEEFVSLVREVLNSTKTVRIISALLAQVDPNWNPLPF
jgi:hypothetical protein